MIIQRLFNIFYKMKTFFRSLYLSICIYSFALDEYNIKLVSQSNNSLIVDFELTNYRIINANSSPISVYKKMAIQGGVPTLEKGEPELLKFTSNIHDLIKEFQIIHIRSQIYST